MTTASASSTSQSSNAVANRRLPQRSYVFVVTALAVFFVGLVIWRNPVSSYIVTAQIGWESPSGEEVGPQAPSTGSSDSKRTADAASLLLEEITIREQLRDAVNLANSQSPTPVFASGSALRDSDLDLLAKQLEAQIRESQDSVTNIELRFESPHAEWAITFLNQLARKAVRPATSNGGKPLASSRDLREARWRLDEARHYERRAQYELQNFMDVHFEQATDDTLDSHTDNEANTATTTASATAAADSSAFVASQPESVASEQKDPQRQRLEQELDDTLARRTRLMRQFTASHPQVRDLTLQAADLRSRLDSLAPQPSDEIPSAGMSPSAEIVETVRPSETVGDIASTSPSISSQDTKTYLALRATLQSATADYELAQESFEDQLHLLTASKANEVPAAAARWMVAPAAVVGHRGGNLAPARVLLIGLVSVTCGMIMAWLAGSMKAVLRINSISDVQALTNLPIVGQLSIDPTTNGVHRLASRQRVVRWGMLGCELTLGLLALTFIATVMAGSPTFAQFADDPFGVFAETIVQAYRARM
jgi:hypothetical protein